MAKRYTSENEIRTLFRRQHGRCAMCGRMLLDVFHIDHVIALARGGTDTLDNKQLLCISCHRVKTSGTKATSLGSDIFEITKTKRLAKGKKDRKYRWPKRSFRLGQKKRDEGAGHSADGGEASDGGTGSSRDEPGHDGGSGNDPAGY